MLLQTCVRCSKGFDQSNNHPLSHFSTIFYECKKLSQETIFDQQKYNSNPLKYMNLEIK
jgi:hypothetical protein